MLGRDAGAAVAHVALEEALQLGIAVGDAVEKACPHRVRRARGCGRAGGFLGDVIHRIRGASDSRAQVESLVSHINLPW